jgi:hypothetical protein
MLSALIPSIHSYPAIHLVAKPVDQRYVQPSPLVDYTTHYCVLRLYLHPSIRMEWGVGMLWRLKSTPSVQRYFLIPAGTSRYGVKPKIDLNSSLDLFCLVA